MWGVFLGRHQTSVWIDEDVYKFFKLQNVNLTQLVNEMGLRMMRDESPEELKKEEQKHLRIAGECRQRLEMLERDGRGRSLVGNIQERAREELLKEFVDGGRVGRSDNNNISWLTGPKRMERVALAGFYSPLECLEFMKENNGVNKR